jgi:hypothetical protein
LKTIFSLIIYFFFLEILLGWLVKDRKWMMSYWQDGNACFCGLWFVWGVGSFF